MSNWGIGLGGFARGFQTGYDVMSSALDRYELQDAKEELQGELKRIQNGDKQNSDLSKIEGSVNLNGVGKEGAIQLPEDRGWMDSSAKENLGKIADASDTIRQVQSLAGGDTVNLNGITDGALSTARHFNVGGVPVEDRSTEYRRNVVLPTDNGVKTVRESYKVGNVPVEDATTPYYKNEMIRQSAENPPRAIQLTASRPSVDSVKAFEHYQATNAPQPAEKVGGQRAIRLNPNGTSVDGSLPVSYSHRAGDYEPPKVPERFAKEEQIARNRRANERLNVEQAQLDKYGGGPIRPSGEPSGNVSAKGTDNVSDFMRQHMSGQLATQPQGQASAIRGGGAAQPAPQAGQTQTRGQTQTAPQAQGQTSALAGGQASGQAPAQGGEQSGAIQLQPGSGNTPIGGQGNSYTDTNYRARQRQIMLAEAKYLLRVDPRAGIAAMKQINQQDAQWELSDMYRGAMQGDPTSLGKIVQFMNIGNQGGEITVSEDGRYAVVTDANGNKTQNIPITPQLIMQTLPMVQATFMAMNGMATDKAIELMQSMMTTGLQQDKLRSETRENDATARYLDARARGADVAPKTDPYSSTDMDGNTYTIDKTTGGPIDLRTGQIYPRGVDPEAFKAWAAENGAWASRFLIRPDAVGLISKDGTKFWNYQTGRIENISQQGGASANPNQPTANVIDGSGDTESLSIASGLIKNLEGFQSQPYSDYTQTSIGYGTRANEGEKSITEAEASKRLEDHIRTEITPKLYKALASVKVGLTPEQKASLISLCYNVGTDTFLRSSAFQALKGGDIKRFVAEVSDPERGFTKTRTAMGGLQVNPGLVERRRKEMEPFLV